MRRPKALDLFCCAGGASMGLYRAGFDVTGVDIKKQPRYPFRFLQADAIKSGLDLTAFDFIWASPPCQKHTAMKTMHNAKEHPDLIPPTRAMLKASGVPYVMENVVGAPLENPVTLCGSMFGLGIDGAQLQRHRIFEASFPLPGFACSHKDGPTIGIYGGHVRNRIRREGSHARGVEDFTFAQGCDAMEIHWMNLMELCQAIPPAYAEHIGRTALALSAGVSLAAE